MSLPDILFKGVPRRYTRGYTAAVIRAVQPQRVVLPCVGAYALAWSAVEAGVPPSAIEACDISLYTSTIGWMLAGDDRWREVQPLSGWEWLRTAMTDAPGVVAAVALAIRILQYRQKRRSLYTRDREHELMTRADSYLAQLRDGAARFQRHLGGLRYQAEDMWQLLDRLNGAGRETLILCNPPRYSGGYDKMFAGIETAFTWPAPTVPQFTEADYRRLLDRLAGGPLTLLYYATPVATAVNPEQEFGPPWRSVFAARPKSGKTSAINWIVANGPVPAVAAQVQRSDVDVAPVAKYKLWTPTDVVSETTQLTVVRERSEVVNYYRDLLVHRLALVNAERYQVLLLDGKLLACLGFHVANLRTSGGGGRGVANLTFAFSVGSKRHARLHKLTLMSVVSSWLWAEEMGDIEPMPSAVQTTMLTPFPEVKTARGIFELQSRERDPKTREFKLKYTSPVLERTPAETVALWLQRWG